MRMAISPRLAMSIFWNIQGPFKGVVAGFEDIRPILPLRRLLRIAGKTRETARVLR
jgi:hypothetical protein